MKAEKATKFPLPKQHLIFFLVLFGLIGCAIVRSSIATRLDSFTYDEAYHIGAAAAYVRTGDFRLNPEHPPRRVNRQKSRSRQSNHVAEHTPSRQSKQKQQQAAVDSPDDFMRRVINEEWPHEVVLAAIAPIEARWK